MKSLKEIITKLSEQSTLKSEVRFNFVEFLFDNKKYTLLLLTDKAIGFVNSRYGRPLWMPKAKIKWAQYEYILNDFRKLEEATEKLYKLHPNKSIAYKHHEILVKIKTDEVQFAVGALDEIYDDLKKLIGNFSFQIQKVKEMKK